MQVFSIGARIFTSRFHPLSQRDLESLVMMSLIRFPLEKTVVLSKISSFLGLTHASAAMLPLFVVSFVTKRPSSNYKSVKRAIDKDSLSRYIRYIEDRKSRL